LVFLIRTTSLTASNYNPKEHYIEEIEQNNRKMKELQSSTENLEKFGREEYLMKKKDEVLFIVEEE